MSDDFKDGAWAFLQGIAFIFVVPAVVALAAGIVCTAASLLLAPGMMTLAAAGMAVGGAVVSGLCGGILSSGPDGDDYPLLRGAGLMAGLFGLGVLGRATLFKDAENPIKPATEQHAQKTAFMQHESLFNTVAKGKTLVLTAQDFKASGQKLSA